MKKVININFQGRIIPIEESAHEILKQYTESLSRFFANEEGKDEIINDIEGRIAELFAETLKKGSTCICEDDVNKIINSIGRPEDFDIDEANVQEQLNGKKQQQNYQQTGTAEHRERTRLYRDENDKILGGVCGGLANYLRVDVSIIRILLVILTFGGGSGFLLYILLWIILPSRNLKTNLTKRLYRNTEDRIIGGVAGGLAAYFNIGVWIPRVIFAMPLIVGIINSIFHNIFSDFSPFPSIVFGSFGGSLMLIYLVLWAVIPEALTASEKLEMRGDKIDLNTIKSTIQDDLEGFKERAEKWGERVQERGSQFTSESTIAAKKHGSKFGHAVGIVFKAFFLFIAGMVAFALLMALLGLLFGGASIYPVKNFFIGGAYQNILLWATVIGFLVIPIIAFVVWVIRRVMKAKSHSRIIGATFGTLWSLGLVACILLAASLASDFKTKSVVEEVVSFNQPTTKKLIVKVERENSHFYGSDWFGIDWDDEDKPPFYGISEDSLLLRSVRVDVNKSPDSLYHIKVFKFCRGKNPEIAKQKAKSINFSFTQNDSVIVLPKGFIVTNTDKFRNQQVLIKIEVPQGKKIKLDGAIGNYEWFEINYNRRNNWSINLDGSWQHSLHWDEDVEMEMGEKDLIRTHKTWEDTQDAKDELDELDKQQKEIEEKRKELKKNLPESPKPEKPEKPATPAKENSTYKLPEASSSVYLANILLNKF